MGYKIYQRSPSKFKLSLILIFVFAFLIRLISLDQSLWLDEGTTAAVVRNYSFSQIINQFSPYDFHPPLYYLFLKFWTIFFGYSEISLRAPSVLFSLMAGYLVFKTGKIISDYKTGLWATAFFLFNPLIIYYSQEARMYAMAVFFLTAALYYFIKISTINFKKSAAKTNYLNHPNRDILFFCFFVLLSFFTFYGSIFLIVPMLIFFIYQKQTKNFFIACLSLLIAFLIIFPLLRQQILNSQLSLAVVLNWKEVLGKANLKNFLLIPVKFAVGRIDFYPKWLYYFISSLWTIYVWSFVFLLAFIKKRKYKKILIYLLFSPLGLGVITSFFTPLLQYFRFLYLIPILALILSLAIKKRLQILTISGMVIFSLAYLVFPQFHREDWKSLARELSREKIFI